MVEILLLKLSFISIIEREGERERERERERELFKELMIICDFNGKGIFKVETKKTTPIGLVASQDLILLVTFEKGMSFTL